MHARHLSSTTQLSYNPKAVGPLSPDTARQNHIPLEAHLLPRSVRDKTLISHWSRPENVLGRQRMVMIIARLGGQLLTCL